MPTYRVTVEDETTGRHTYVVNAINPAHARLQLNVRFAKRNARLNAMNPGPEVTDRALRYRAQQTPPAGEPICAFCGSDRTVEIGHIDGFEEHLEPENLVWTCRSCNTIMGHVFAQQNIGRRTRQYNPATSGGAKTMAQWVTAVMSMKGESDQMSVKDAVELIKETPPERRAKFAREIYGIRKRRGHTRTRRDEVPF